MPSHSSRSRNTHVATPEEVAFRLAVGQRIRALRAENYSQESFADAVEVYRTQMSLIERGKADLKLSTLYRIATVLGVTASEILALPDEQPCAAQN